MDRPGQSWFQGSVHLNGLRPEEDEAEEEEEEENRQRKEQMQEMFTHAFSDLEEQEESSITNINQDVSASNEAQRSFTGNQVLTQSEYPGDYQVNVEMRDIPRHEPEVIDEHSVHSNRESTGYSNSYHDTPWSDCSEDQSDRFSPLSHHDTGGNLDYLQENVAPNNDQPSLSLSERREREVEPANRYVLHDQYSPDRYKSDLNTSVRNIESISNEFQSANCSSDQLKLLYEVRGRELDKQMAELTKVKSDSKREIRALQHHVGLLTSENSSYKSNINNLQILLSQKEDIVKNLKNETTTLQKKNLDSDTEIKRMRLELENAESTISSLECQISELKAADSLSRNQKLQEDFVRKLRSENQDQTDFLSRKVEQLQQESENQQTEVKHLRDQLKSLRKVHDDLLIQKTETATKLSVTVQTLQKQYEDLLQSHGSHKILEMQIINKNLEAEKNRMVEKIQCLEEQVVKYKEEVKSYDSAVMFGIFNEEISVEDSMVQLGIKKALDYDETGQETVKTAKEPMTQVQLMLKLKEELKRIFIVNKAKRDEIARLQEEVKEKQNHLIKVQSDLKSSHVEIKELKEREVKRKLEQSENQFLNMNGTDNVPDLKAIQVENISLKEELNHFYHLFRNMNQSAEEFNNFMKTYRKEFENGKAMHDSEGVLNQCSTLLKTSENFNKILSDLEEYHKMIAKIREENQKLQKESSVWERRIQAFEVKLNVFLEMIGSAISDPSNVKEYLHAQNVIQKLLNDVKKETLVLKENAFVIKGRTTYFENQLETVKLELEKQKLETLNLTKEKEALQKDLITSSKLHEEDKTQALQSCQETYLKFHEDAMKEIEAKFNAEYENIASKLKNEITRLANELSNVKTLYVGVCEEKNELEKLLDDERLKVDNSNLIGTKSLVTDPLNKESINDKRFYENRILELEKQVINNKTQYEVDCKKLVSEKKELEKQYKDLFESNVQPHTDRVRELEQKCTELFERNLALEKKNKEFKAFTDNAPENNTSFNAKSRMEELQKFQERIQEHKSRYEGELKGMKSKFEIELNIMKEREKEGEENIQKLTDMVMNLESDLKEQQDTYAKNKAVHQRKFQEMNEDLSQLKHNLKYAHDEVAKLKEVSSKYNSLKRKFKEYHEASDEQRKQYKQEISRMHEELGQFKENLIKRMQDYIEDFKEKFMCYFETTLNAMKHCADKDQCIKRRLEEVKREVSKFTLIVI